MSRETDPDSDGYLCQHCGKAKTDHALTVHPVSGIVVAGAYTGPDTFTYCQGEDAAKALDRQGRRYRKEVAALERELAEMTDLVENWQHRYFEERKKTEAAEARVAPLQQVFGTQQPAPGPTTGAGEG